MGPDGVMERFEHCGCSVEIVVDESPESPREWDNLGTLVFGARAPCSGDRTPTEGELAALAGGGWAGLVRHVSRAYGASVVLPVSVLSHSGVSCWVGSGASASDPGGWDSGFAGWIFDSAAGRDMCGTPPDRIEECLGDEVATFSLWLCGDVYGYIVTGPGVDGCKVSESCWGYYGIDDAVSCARAVAEGMAASVAAAESAYLRLAGVES